MSTTHRFENRDTPDRVAVIRGGNSAEREISLKTGRAVEAALETFPADILTYDTSRDLAERLRSDGCEVAFLALHGPGGEDGTIQGLLDWVGIPYTGPGLSASALCMDKIRTRQVADSLGIPSPDWIYLDREETMPKFDHERYLIKPASEGSSLGMSLVENGDPGPALEEARQYDERILVEEHVEGYEVTVGVVNLGETRILPPVGIRPRHEFFDFDTKYTEGLTEYDVPARVSEDVRQTLRDMTLNITRATQTQSLCRVDYIVDTRNTPQFLEINTIPGFTETSLLPKAAREAGLSFEELVQALVLQAWEEFEWELA